MIITSLSMLYACGDTHKYTATVKLLENDVKLTISLTRSEYLIYRPLDSVWIDTDKRIIDAEIEDCMEGVIEEMRHN